MKSIANYEPLDCEGCPPRIKKLCSQYMLYVWNPSNYNPFAENDRSFCVLWKLKYDKRYRDVHFQEAAARDDKERRQKQPLIYGNGVERRAAKSKKLLATLSEKQWEFIKYTFNDRCCYCGRRRKLTKDHYIPLDEGGALTHRNILPACRSCNSSKGTNGAMYWFRKQLFYSYKRELMIRWMLNYGK